MQKGKHPIQLWDVGGQREILLPVLQQFLKIRIVLQLLEYNIYFHRTPNSLG